MPANLPFSDNATPVQGPDPTGEQGYPLAVVPATGSDAFPVNIVGGGGGAVTIADGADVAEGSTTDAAVTGDNPGTVSAKLRGLNKILFDVWDAVNHWFRVGASQVGVWNVNSVGKGASSVTTATINADGQVITIPTEGFSSLQVELSGPFTAGVFLFTSNSSQSNLLDYLSRSAVNAPKVNNVYFSSQWPGAQKELLSICVAGLSQVQLLTGGGFVGNIQMTAEAALPGVVEQGSQWFVTLNNNALPADNYSLFNPIGQVQSFPEEFNGNNYERLRTVGGTADMNGGSQVGIQSSGQEVYNGKGIFWWEYQRTPKVFKAVAATAAGNTALWTPAAGKKFRLMCYMVQVTEQAQQAVGGTLTITLFDGAAGATGQAHDVFVPAASLGTAGDLYTSPWIDLGNGFLSAALTAGNVRVICCGTEE